MTQSEFQETVLRKLAAQSDKLSANDEFQERVLGKLASIETRLQGVEKTQQRQTEVNEVIITELERLGKMRTDLVVMAETSLVEQADIIREQNRMYTDRKLSGHEAAFH